MEKQVKDLSIYKKKFEEDIMSFREFESMDYIRELKNQNQLDEAIEVGRTFLSSRPELKTYINHYAYALYNKYISQDASTISKNEKLYYGIVEDILAVTKQEKYSPYEPTINHVIKYVSSKEVVDYEIINQYLEKVDPLLLSKEPYLTNNKKEGESRFERWYRLKVRALFELERYKECITFANQAFAQTIKWHYRNLQWIQYYRAMSNLKLKNYGECERDFLALQGQIQNINFYRALYDLYISLERYQEANVYLIYDIYITGYNLSELPLYESLLSATKVAKDKQLEEVVSAFIYKIKEETTSLNEQDTIIDKFKEINSSDLYDRMIDELTNSLENYVERKTGKIVYYNNQKSFGSIASEDPLFFRQSDFIYDEEIKRFDLVEYTVMKTFDFKKNTDTTKAVLILLNDDFDGYVDFD